ncbi:MAG: metallophosphoesterase family protein [Nitrospirota bacterium]
MRIGKRLLPLLIFIAAITNGIAAQDQPLQQKLAVLEKLPSKFSFVVLGDNRAGDPACDAVYQKVITAALTRKPDLIVNTGDQIDKPGNVEHWKRFRELSRDVTVPYFLTVGNHDAHVEVAGSEETYKAQVDLPGKEIYYSFAAGNSLFVVLDSYIKGEDKRITGKQFTWLEQVLSASKHKHKFVFVHHPLFPVQGRGKHYGNSLDRYPGERDRLHALMKRHGVTMVFSGHEHVYLRRIVNGIPYIIAGGGGAPLYTDDLNGGFHHYVSVTVDGDNVSGEVVDVKGNVRDKF